MIALGSDHGGFELKEAVKKHLQERGLEFKDFGTYDLNSCDYPEFGRAAAEAVASGECDRGIVICTTGIGISIVANKVKGIRCALCSEKTSAFRDHIGEAHQGTQRCQYACNGRWYGWNSTGSGNC